MIIQLHTPKGIVEVDTELVADKSLAKLNISRANLAALIPRDLYSELDAIKSKVEKLEKAR